ncbi:hypothetical protein [Streptomyces tsukubensis]|uniref:hypothetical protein n=2 Tax=Actinomycetes TaxID=1760 RepID=UPI00344C693B
MTHEPPTVIVDIYAARVETGATPGAIRLWLHRGQLAHHGYDHAGRARVDLHELKALIAAKAKAA